MCAVLISKWEDGQVEVSYMRTALTRDNVTASSSEILVYGWRSSCRSHIPQVWESRHDVRLLHFW